MIGKVEAIKKFFGAVKPVKFSELKVLILEDKEGYEWMATECARELGEELKEDKG